MVGDKFKEKYGYNPIGNFDIIFTDAARVRNHSDMTKANYTPPVAQQIMERDRENNAAANNAKEDEAQKQQKKSEKKKSAKNVNTADFDKIISEIVSFIEKENVSEAAIAGLMIKVFKSGSIRKLVNKIMDIIGKTADKNNIRDSVAQGLVDNMDEKDFIQTIQKFWDEIKKDDSMKEEKIFIEKLLKFMEEKGYNIEDAFNDIMSKNLHPEDDKPETETTKETSEAKQAAAAPDSIIPDEVLDENGNTVANVPAQTDNKDLTGVTISFKDTDYVNNNEAFIKNYPKLRMFTKYAKSANFWVIYEEVDGLINATLVEKETNKIARVLKLDYKVIYGDTLRIITNNNKEGDLRKELFIPIESTGLANKAIKGETITKEERKEYYSKLPRAISDFRQAYSFVDRVDMSGLKISTEKWYQLVVNISTVLTNNLIPVCRFKVDEYKSPEDFLLVATDQVPVFKSGIMEESSHKFALSDRIAIDYDVKLYANDNDPKVFDHKYKVGHF